MESNENGIWVEFRDYLRLLEDYKSSQQWKREADAETLKFDSGDWFASKTLPERIKHIIEANAFSNDQWKDVDAENARLKVEVERLTKEKEAFKDAIAVKIARLIEAGDTMAMTLHYEGDGYALNNWNAAKKGDQP